MIAKGYIPSSHNVSDGYADTNTTPVVGSPATNSAPSPAKSP